MVSYNIKFPLEDDVSTNTYFKMTKVTKDAVSSDLLFLLLTEKGERYYDPEFGTNLLKFIFEPDDNITQADIETDIKNTVTLYIPTVTIESVTFNTLIDDAGNDLPENQLNVKIKFTYSEDVFSEGGELDLYF